MKIVSWNCNGKFREKYRLIIETDADIYIIQECEDPKFSNIMGYTQFATNYFWCGDNKNKGLGIFAKQNIVINLNHWKSYCLRNFLSVNVNNCFDLLGVWACYPYIEEYYVYQSINFTHYNQKTIIMGDFNSNKIWDKSHNDRSHMAVVNELEKKHLIPAYHYVYNEKQGEETRKTFYLYRHLDKGYHIDHCFLSKESIKDYRILDDDIWLKYSDHLPILLEI